ncbi:carbohydrate ABC transporter permease [Phycicoccus sp. MAQZ13P-2]|uniref:carbohydrate ABC transporter permease n=1 Tax=Phycicoccus TaxID=367298 RepID=UPI0004C3A2B9|nr:MULTISPECIES: carbohydrate ABC transporter permease [Phycicoccus]MBT9255543.1 carbohydrate ABC transporter permease [Phycicoccus mangrovi]MBT9275257.1 carbohydrate ABC transporter permease [Phycicoccus mangrovi]GIL36384.1 sugar ABC transporter permease [Phycicoccus sp. DTK01]
MRVSRAERATNYVILAAFAVFALWPILGVVVAALGPDDAAGGTVGAGVLGLHPENFVTAWNQGRFGSYLRTSLLVSSTVVVVSVVFSLLAGYALGTMRFRGATVLFYVFLVGIMMPSEAVLVPLYYDLRALGLTDTIWALLLPQVAQSVAFGTFWMRAWFRSANRSVVEAARLDGASTWRILWQVLVPLARPAVVTLTVLTFMWTWNEFLVPLVMVVSESLRTAPLGLAFFQGQYTQGFTLLAAGACIVATPVVVLYLFLQRHFIAGMLEGAVRE